MNTFRNYHEICGIIGGVGPAATNYLFGLIIKLHKAAKKDQNHIPLLIFNNPQIPDRTEHLINGGENPLSELIQTANILKKAGATFIAIPCITAHVYIKEIEKEAGIKTINLIKLTLDHIRTAFGKTAIVGLLATDGTIKSNIFKDEMNGLNIVIPDKHGQKNVMEAVYGKYGLKASCLNNRNFKLLYHEAKKLIKNKANVIVAGCTEIPLVLKQSKCNFPIIDPMELMAKEILERTLNNSSFKA